AILIFAIVALNALIGMIQEDKAEKSLKALQDMSTPTAKVIRGGEEQTINSNDVVVGDLIVMDAGDLVPADLRIVQSNSLTVQEASLTGESVPVEKHADVVCAEDAVLRDRNNMASSSGMVSYGRGQGVDVDVCMGIAVAKIASMLF
ncbi:HAD-IC family P-type ATPase, partial [Erysipelothrix rhusiopathiae]|nr:HAD-IC family P-type ATPase [Erysipelothrix rhusiopathiae]